MARGENIGPARPLDTHVEPGGPRGSVLEGLTAGILRTGLVLSLLVIAAGGALAALRHPDYLTSAEEYLRLTRGAAASPHTVGEILRGLLALDARALIMLGVLILLATPVLRVGVSAVLFARRGERPFAAMALAVLAILASSFFVGRGG
jgi:uncharacterized membrane protein